MERLPNLLCTAMHSLLGLRTISSSLDIRNVLACIERQINKTLRKGNTKYRRSSIQYVRNFHLAALLRRVGYMRKSVTSMENHIFKNVEQLCVLTQKGILIIKSQSQRIFQKILLLRKRPVNQPFMKWLIEEFLFSESGLQSMESEKLKELCKKYYNRKYFD